jgi:hypothetical protein
MYTLVINALLFLILLVFLLEFNESFMGYYNTPKTRMEHTCDELVMDNTDYTRKEFDGPTYKLYHDDKTDEKPYAFCGDLNANDSIKNNNYRFGAPSTDPRVKRRFLSASDKYYGLNKLCPGSKPVFW